MTSLRDGFTTGTAAAAAAKAAVVMLRGLPCPRAVDVPLPAGGRLTIPIAWCRQENTPQETRGPTWRARVIKDAGDDPDATHGAAIEATAVLIGESHVGDVELCAGQGVGMVTLPGLPVAVGQPAINPVPRQQIIQAVAEGLEGVSASVRITIEVPDGVAIARRTLNGRLGIMGGISILGTRGTVRPYSHEAWGATIAAGLNVARAAGLDSIAFSTGGRSERQLMALLPGWPQKAFIQAADHFGLAMDAAAQRGFQLAVWGVFFGKLVKQAQGLYNTHARQEPTDFGLLARHCAMAGLPPAICAQAEQANTALQVLELVRGHPAAQRLYDLLLHAAAQIASGFGHGRMGVAYALLDFDGSVLATYGPWSDAHTGNRGVT